MTLPDRKSSRLAGYDYSQPGAYFITVVVQGKACLFGQVDHGEMRANEPARMVEK